MEKSQLPPSYNEIFPTAPPNEENSFQQNVPGWNQQYAQTYQQPLIPQQQPTITQQPLQNQQTRPAVVVINQQVIFGENPIVMICPHCQSQIVTKIEFENNVINHSIALGLCIFGFWCCCCIPYCVNSIKDVIHNCSKCGQYLGKYRRGRV